MKQIVIFAIITLISLNSYSQHPTDLITPVIAAKVSINDNFWTPIQDKVATKTIYACVDQLIKTNHVRNFENAALGKGEHGGANADDSDLYKVLEGIAYSLKNHPDPALEKIADNWIDKIAASQQSDGYLNTYYTIKIGLDKRWTNMQDHEDYCAGHLIEAAVAYYNSTGKRKFLDVAIRVANNMDSVFRLANNHWVTGHEEVKIALAKLYRVTNNRCYLDLAEWFIDQRGHGYWKGKAWGPPTYYQDDVPVEKARKIEGHAVRAMYLYAGVTDIATLRNETKYNTALLSVWDNLIGKNMYVTGGIGSSGENEGFSKDYDLPNEHAYCETCASIAMMFWNLRMNCMTGESKYADIMERALYNGVLAGLSLNGDRFFYGNPLASVHGKLRSEWFAPACCPSNMARLFPSLGNYIYVISNDAIYINLFVGSKTNIPVGKNNEIQIVQEGNYPWDGTVTININPYKKMKHKILIRLPDWAFNETTPEGAYSFNRQKKNTLTILLNGADVGYKIEKGYAVLDREWKKGDRIKFELPMDVLRVIANSNIKENINRVALQRGPLIYCVEHADNNGKALNMILTDKANFSTVHRDGLLGGVVTIDANASVVETSSNGDSVNTIVKNITAIPYYSWANRGKGEMQVWIPRIVSGASLLTIK